MTSELQQNRYDRLIRRVGGIIGVGSKVSEVLTELFPMIDVEGDRGELQLLSGTTLGMGTRIIVGAAGENAKIQLFNPVNSGQLVTITDVYISSTVSQALFIGRTANVLGTPVGTELSRDTRISLTNRPAGKIFSESSAGFTQADMILRILQDVTFHLFAQNDVMVLAPGTGMDVGTGTVNTLLSVTFLWRERTAESSELKF